MANVAANTSPEIDAEKENAAEPNASLHQKKVIFDLSTNHEEEEKGEELGVEFSFEETQLLLSPKSPSDNQFALPRIIKEAAFFSPLRAVGQSEFDFLSKKVVEYEVDPSPLYKFIQMKDWNAVMEQVEQSPEEVSTWIFRKEKDGALRWCLLPIHAALIFKAPGHVVEKILSHYPEAGLCKDDQGMVPLHLAFRHGASDAVLYELLSSCPDAIDVRDSKGRTPLALHSTYVARTNAIETPSTGGDNVTKKRPSAFEMYVNIASERARKSSKSKMEASINKKLKAVQDEHSRQLERLRKIASDESRDKMKDVDRQKRDLQSALDLKNKELKDTAKDNADKEALLSEMETMLNKTSKAKEEVKVELQ